MTERSYNDMARRIRSHRGTVVLIRFLNKSIVATVMIAYIFLLGYLEYAGRHEELYHSILVPAVAFLVLSLFRKCISAKRPYEEMEIEPIIPKDKSGSSFPSRHVFSVFIIAVTFLPIFPDAGIVLMVLGVILAVIRVIGGVHYTRDVVCGAAIGIISGLLGFYVIF